MISIHDTEDADPDDYDATVAAVLEAYEDIKAGRTRPADEVLEELRVRFRFEVE